MKCLCSNDAVLLKVTKDGPNQGRPFYKCKDGGCNLFKWADSTSSLDPPVPKPRALQLTKKSDSKTNLMNTHDDEQKKCNCGIDAALRKVNKEGATKGRYFWGCSQKEGCKLFSWCDNPELYLKKKNEVQLLISI
jgi:DNA topoisomerase-3